MTSTTSGDAFILRYVPAHVLGERVDDLFKRGVRPIANQPFQFDQRGNTPRNIRESTGIRLFVRHPHNLGVRTHALLYQFGELIYRNLVIGSDIDHLSGGFRRRRKPQQRLSDVSHMREATGLPAIAEYGDRQPEQGLVNERGQDHSIAVPLPRTRRVEESNNRYG